jgi:multimeric flavodoxin WrbA
MAATRLLVLRSSPRKRGNSSILADRLADGARAAGAAVESYDLAALDIRPCDACDYCQDQGAGQCQINDDMQMLYPKLMQADGIVIAGPIYWFTISAQAKLCIDRWYALQGPGGSALAGKKVGIILTYGDDDPCTSGVMNAIHAYQDMFHYVGAEIAGILHASVSRAGEVEGRPDVLQCAYQLGQRLGSKG